MGGLSFEHMLVSWSALVLTISKHINNEYFDEVASTAEKRSLIVSECSNVSSRKFACNPANFLAKISPLGEICH